jgi:endonuclease III
MFVSELIGTTPLETTFPSRYHRYMPQTPRLEPREIVERLEEIYGNPGIVLRKDPMDELVSCILSQHTSDKNSFPTFDRLKAAYPTWEQVAALSQEQLADVIRAAGLANQKSRSIQACLQAIREKNGEYSIDNLRSMPLREARKWLEALPGVGPKTASIVLCFSFGMGAIPVDTHVFRVGWRLGFYPQKVGEGKAHDVLLDIVPADLAFRFHVALIQHGREVCKAPLPRCPKCPLQDVCWWRGQNGPECRRKEIEAEKTRRKQA